MRRDMTGEYRDRRRGERALDDGAMERFLRREIVVQLRLRHARAPRDRRRRRPGEPALGEDTVEIVATLVATSIVPEELDAAVEGLEKLPGVDHASWESETQSQS